ncbi:single-stranded DNA-binding protein [Leptolyngbya sp. FACHB-17]|uniref:single-stranded DNA-binding protein n=1 Tax=unclassified Leptolyngbya TaxID=2650499 RepID=UPI00168089D5|nr:single-stranded DNA-binding protein [Leptolyngbya sp. FACHB-17]MBD2082669.1 single-stranded DNA-binding protein [Leptolyngbya sp. FACHB-17]
MNSIILLADIIQEPQLRFTSDNQTPIAELRVEFAGLRPEDPATQLKAVGWGNLAQEIQANYHQGDRVILEGRLTMNTVDRPEGFKEKQAELTIQRIHALNGASISSSVTTEAPTRAPSTPPPAATTPKRTPKAPTAPALESQPELDDIPF